VLPVTRPPIEFGTVGVEGSVITYVGPRADAPPGDDDDLGDAALLPGLVNAHTHLELTAMRGFLEELDFQPWIRALTESKRAALADRQALLDSARLGVAEGLLAGVTTYADTCASGVAFDAMREAGVRGIMYQELFGPDPHQCDESMRGLRATVSALRPFETPLVRVGVSPHAPYSVSDDLFAAVANYARREALPVAVHVAESGDESRLVAEGVGPFADALRRRGIAVAPARARTPVALLARTGVLAARPLLIHCTRIDDADVREIAAAGCPVAHCPASNAKLGHGVAPLVELLAAGVAVGLGSDSVASNNRMDVLEEARLAVLFQRARLHSPRALPAAQALELATLGGARALGLGDRVGSLAVGKEADLAAFPLGSPRALPLFDPTDALVHALAGRPASYVAVAGRVLVRDGRLTSEDAGLAGRVEAAARALVAWREASAAIRRYPVPGTR